MEFKSYFFKKGCLLVSCSFIRHAMVGTDIFQWKSCGNVSAEINYDHNFNKKNGNDDHFDDNYDDKTY